MLATVEHGHTVVSGYLHAAGPGRHASDAVMVDTIEYGGRHESISLGAMPLAMIDEPYPVTVRPHLRFARVEPQRSHLLGVMVEGTGSLSSSGRTVRLRPGTITLYPSADHFALRFDDAHRYVVAEIPDDLIGPAGRGFGFAVANAELASTPAAKMIADLVRHLPGHGHRIPGLVRGQLGETVAGLLRTAIDDVDGLLDQGEGTGGLVEAVLAWIDLHLGEPELSPGRIAAANHMSVRYLHRLFQQRGTTVGEHIRLRRVERIKADLAAPQFDGWTVSAIGARWGVLDATQLGRQFRAVECTTPGAWRRAVHEARAVI